MRFRYREVGGWPPLAWLAECRPGEPAVTVFHGPAVETGGDWFGEIVWDGARAEGGFDRTDVVFGTGARRRGGSAVFVPPGTTVDRLQHLRAGGSVWVSNSLVCLAAVHDAGVDPAYAGYLYDFRSVIEGIEDYEKTLETDAGPVRFTYYHNLRWDGRSLEVVAKPRPDRRFDAFEDYRRCLSGALRRLAGNLSDPGRDRPWRMLGTISTGYDSPAVAALGREAGLEEAITFRTARLGKEDDGREIGRMLGIDVEPYPYEGWQEEPRPCVPCLAGSATAGEIYLEAAEDRLENTVLLTGEYGGHVWSRRLYDPDGVLETTDPAGLSLTEYRLWSGFVHCPVPYIGARRSRDLVRIANAPEMEPWSVGGYYDRPVPRRIVEEAGVPREAFGTEKKYGAVSFSHPDVFWSRPWVDEFLDWLADRRGAWLRRGRPPPRLVSAAARPVQACARAAVRAFDALAADRGSQPSVVRRLRYASDREYLFTYMFPWALERAKERYRVPGAPGAAGTAARGTRERAAPADRDAEGPDPRDGRRAGVR